MLIKHQSVQTPEVLVRLWMHEMSRIFGDRLADLSHRVMFEHMLVEAVGRSVAVRTLVLFYTGRIEDQAGQISVLLARIYEAYSLLHK